MIAVLVVLSLALCVLAEPMMVMVDNHRILPAGTFPVAGYPYPYAPGVHPSYYNSLYYPHAHPHPFAHPHPHPHPHRLSHPHGHALPHPLAHQLHPAHPHPLHRIHPTVHPIRKPVHPTTYRPTPAVHKQPVAHKVSTPVHKAAPITPTVQKAKPVVHTVKTPVHTFNPAVKVAQPAAQHFQQPFDTFGQPATVRVLPPSDQYTFGYHAQYPQLYPTSFSGQPIFEQAQTAAGPAIVKYNPVPSPIVQHHAQNIYGAADYGYSHPGQFHEAMRDIYGGVTGTYAYLDPEGKEVRVEYVADDQGFRVKTNGLPQGPVGVAPTEEVRRATEEHLRLVAETQKDVSRTKRHSTGYPHSHHIMTPHVVQSRRPTITYIPSSPYHHGPVYKSHPIYVNPQRYPVPHAYNFPHRLPYYQPGPYAPTYNHPVYGHPSPYSGPVHLQQSPIHHIRPYKAMPAHKHVSLQKAVSPYKLISEEKAETEVKEVKASSEE